MSLVNTLVEAGEVPATPVGEYLSETTRLISKRVFTLIVEETEVEKVVNTIIDVNSTGNPGDGKIFVLPILENYKVRNGEATVEAY
jgi:nitrogen regulatory protein PII 2